MADKIYTPADVQNALKERLQKFEGQLKELWMRELRKDDHMEPGVHEAGGPQAPQHMEPGGHENAEMPMPQSPPEQPVGSSHGIPAGQLDDLCPMCGQPDAPGQCTCLNGGGNESLDPAPMQPELANAQPQDAMAQNLQLSEMSKKEPWVKPWEKKPEGSTEALCKLHKKSCCKSCGMNKTVDFIDVKGDKKTKGLNPKAKLPAGDEVLTGEASAKEVSSSDDNDVKKGKGLKKAGLPNEEQAGEPAEAAPKGKPKPVMSTKWNMPGYGQQGEAPAVPEPLPGDASMQNPIPKDDFLRALQVAAAGRTASTQLFDPNPEPSAMNAHIRNQLTGVAQQKDPSYQPGPMHPASSIKKSATGMLNGVGKKPLGKMDGAGGGGGGGASGAEGGTGANPSVGTSTVNPAAPSMGTGFAAMSGGNVGAARAAHLGKKAEELSKPPKSEAQRRAMRAAASGNSTLGIPKKVGKEFSAADPGGKLPEVKKVAVPMAKPPSGGTGLAPKPPAIAKPVVPKVGAPGAAPKALGKDEKAANKKMAQQHGMHVASKQAAHQAQAPAPKPPLNPKPPSHYDPAEYRKGEDPMTTKFKADKAKEEERKMWDTHNEAARKERNAQPAYKAKHAELSKSMGVCLFCGNGEHPGMCGLAKNIQTSLNKVASPLFQPFPKPRPAAAGLRHAGQADPHGTPTQVSVSNTQTATGPLRPGQSPVAFHGPVPTHAAIPAPGNNQVPTKPMRPAVKAEETMEQTPIAEETPMGAESSKGGKKEETSRREESDE